MPYSCRSSNYQPRMFFREIEYYYESFHSMEQSIPPVTVSLKSWTLYLSQSLTLAGHREQNDCTTKWETLPTLHTWINKYSWLLINAIKMLDTGYKQSNKTIIVVSSSGTFEFLQLTFETSYWIQKAAIITYNSWLIITRSWKVHCKLLGKSGRKLLL